jgi:prevent-host-death family protein
VTISAETCRVALGYWLDRVAAGEDAVVTRRGKPMIRLTSAAPTSASQLGRAATAQTVLPPAGAARSA